MRAFPTLDSIRTDLAFAGRSLRRAPTFTFLAVAVLALGIGANTAAFSLVNGVLLAPLPYPEPDRLVNLAEVKENGGEARVSYPNFRDWHERAAGPAGSFAGMALYTGWPGPTAIEGGNRPGRATVIRVSKDFFPLLGVEPLLGRTFLAEESREGADPAAVLSHGLWRRDFGERTDLQNLMVRFGGVTYRIVGVLPPGTAFPEEGEIWVPQELTPSSSGRTAHNWRVLGRLAEGTSLAAARQQMTAVAAVLQEAHAGDNDAVDVRVTPLKEEMVGDSRQALLVLLGAALLVLLTACSNLASSFLARALARRQELAIRSALGAGRRRVFQQLLTESLLLTGLGAAAGLALAFGLVRMLQVLRPYDLPRLETLAVDGPVLAFTVALALVVALVFAFLPARLAGRGDLRKRLAAGARGASHGRRWSWRALVSVEVALALVLLVGSGLLLKSLVRILSVDPGFETENVVTLDFTVPGLTPPKGFDLDALRALEPQVAAFSRQVLEQVEALPGVQAAGLINEVPLGGSDSNGTFLLGDRPKEDSGYGSYRVVGGDYFQALGIPFLRGGPFGDLETGAPHEVIVNESLARRYWPDKDPLGERLLSYGMDVHWETWMTVVGVVADVHHRGLTTEPVPEIYVPVEQRGMRAMGQSLVVRSKLPPETLLPSVRHALKELAPEMPLTVSSMEQKVQASVAEERFQLAVLGAFALLALLLAASGIYGVVSYAAAQRKREMGIRLALGAAPGRVVGLVVAESLRTVAVGLAVGLAGSLLLGRVLARFLYEIEPGDPGTFALVLAVLLAAALAASYLPARRLARVDPAWAVRGD